MKQKLLNLVTYAMIGWGAFSATYLALPPEIQDLLPNMNWVTAVVSGGSTTLLGSISLYVKGYINKNKLVNNEMMSGVTNLFNNITETKDEIISHYKELMESIQRNNILLETELKTKLDNPLLTESAKALIEGVLNEDE